MLNDEKQLEELRLMKTRNDSFNRYVDYENNILIKTLSPYLFENAMMNNYLIKLQKLLAFSFDKVNIIKNWKNYTVEKYHYKQKG